MSQDLPTRLKAFRTRVGMTQAQIAQAIQVTRSSYANYESGVSTPNQNILDSLAKLGFQPLAPGRQNTVAPSTEVGPPLIPAPQLLIPLPSIGYVSASDKVDWTDPFESESFAYVPPEMGDVRGRFACKCSSDSMMPLIEPEDTLVFQRTDVPRIGHVILFRSDQNQITVKKLAHDGTNYLLVPLNSRYQTVVAEGAMLGYLVGIVREKGSRRTTDYDASGIIP